MMNRRLKISTIERVLKRYGFTSGKRYDTVAHFFLLPINPGSFVLSFLNSGLVKASARWSKGVNVHIDSYFNWPSTLRDLDHIVLEIQRIYTELKAIGNYQWTQN